MKVMTEAEMGLTLRCAELEYDLAKSLAEVGRYEKMLSVVHAYLFPEIPFEELTAPMIEYKLEGLLHGVESSDT